MLKYVSGYSGEVIDLYSEKIKGRIKIAGFYDYEWRIDETRRHIGSIINDIGKNAVSYELTLDFLGNREERAEAANAFFDTIERDMQNKKMGRLYFKGYYIECYIVKIITGGRDKRSRMIQSMATVFVPHPFWVKETTYSFLTQQISSNDNKRYPYQYGYRYANGLTNTYVINEHFADSDFELTIYGPVAYPQVTIGDHTYLVYTILQAGEYLEIDSRTGTIYKVTNTGEKINEFHNRKKGMDFFRKIPSGRMPVKWPNSFGFDLTIYEERSIPKW